MLGSKSKSLMRKKHACLAICYDWKKQHSVVCTERLFTHGLTRCGWFFMNTKTFLKMFLKPMTLRKLWLLPSKVLSFLPETEKYRKVFGLSWCRKRFPREASQTMRLKQPHWQGTDSCRWAESWAAPRSLAHLVNSKPTDSACDLGFLTSWPSRVQAAYDSHLQKFPQRERQTMMHLLTTNLLLVTTWLHTVDHDYWLTTWELKRWLLWATGPGSWTWLYKQEKGRTTIVPWGMEHVFHQDKWHVHFPGFGHTTHQPDTPSFILPGRLPGLVHLI